MVLIYSSDEVVVYYMLKGIILGTPAVGGISASQLYITKQVTTVLLGPQLFSTVTWIVPPNYTGVYKNFNAVVWYSGLNFGWWTSQNYYWLGKVITTIEVYGNTSGTINFYQLAWVQSNNTYSTSTVLTWSGTINGALTLSYSDNQPAWYGAFAYYFNLANTVTVVIYYNFNVSMYGTLQIPVYVINTVTIYVDGSVSIASQTTTLYIINVPNITINYPTNTLQYIVTLPYYQNSTIVNYITIAYRTLSTIATETLYTPYLVIYT
jgi:hypothetical protein